MNTQPPVRPARRAPNPPASPWAVECTDLTKTYGDFTAVGNLDLHVPHGGIYGFLGPNGAGKSTTMKLLLGLTRPTSGHMNVLGQDISGGHRVKPGQIGSLIEGPAFYPSLTAQENLAMMADYLELPQQTVPHALATVGLRETGKKQVKNFSLGMKQRLGIAMALLGDPPLLLLDEPTNGLDPAGVAEIRHLIVNLARQQGTTVIVSSHILSEIEQMADTVAIISHGRLRYEGSLEDLQDDGHLEFSAQDPTPVTTVLSSRNVPWTLAGSTVHTPMLTDAEVVQLVAAMVDARAGLFRVQSERKTLEQAFLELTAPQHDEAVAA